jgi:hypothetical protein
MPTNRISCAKAPCKSCPYRRDVPSGIWAAIEYDKLPAYDAEILDQLRVGAGGLFYCHHDDGQLCAGWIGCHGAYYLAAMRIAAASRGADIDPALWEYRSPVPLWPSGAAAAEHGKRAIHRPGPKARRAIDVLVRQKGRGS